MKMRPRRIAKAGLAGALSSLIWQTAPLAQGPVPVDGQYELFAAGLHIADVRTDFVISPQSYEMRLSYHTVGVVGFFAHGNSDSIVSGVWQGNAARPRQFRAEGSSKGDPRLTVMDFVAGMPIVRQLLPDDVKQRQPVPEALKAGAVDTLSAMTELMRMVAVSGRCDLTVRTFDGHRVIQFHTRTVGPEVLEPYRSSHLTGTATRCDFTETPVAGMKTDEASDARPSHGSIWLASPVAGVPLMPVRMAFETRWFGDAMMYLVKAKAIPGMVVAGAR